MKSIDLSSIDLTLDDNDTGPMKKTEPALSDDTLGIALNTTVPSSPHEGGLNIGQLDYEPTNIGKPAATNIRELQASPGNGPSSAISQIPQMKGGEDFPTLGMSSSKKAVLFLISLLIAGGATIGVTGPHEDPIDNIFEFIMGEGALSPNSFPDLAEKPKPKPKVQPMPEGESLDKADLAATIEETGQGEADGGLDELKSKLSDLSNPMTGEPIVVNTFQASPEDLKNPYWPLPNDIVIDVGERPRMSANWENRWKIGLNHRFVGQQYSTLREMRREKRRGAELLYFKALDSNKLWHRMHAILGMIELGFKVDLELVERAIGKARPSLVSNFFKRMIEKPTEAEIYLMRQAIRVVGPRSRVIILTALKGHRGGGHELYFAAARNDPAPLVKSWMDREMMFQPVPQTKLAEYQQILENYKIGRLAFEVPAPDEFEELGKDELGEDVSIVEEVTFIPEKTKDDTKGVIVSPSELVSDGFDDMNSETKEVAVVNEADQGGEVNGDPANGTEDGLEDINADYPFDE